MHTIMKSLFPHFVTIITSLLLVVSHCQGEDSTAAPAAITHPDEQYELTLESGGIWNIGNNTPINYTIIPTQLTLRTPTVLHLMDNRHGRVVIRTRISLPMESIITGPENYYFGISGSPSIEWWSPNDRISLYFSIGGGVGVVDSQDVVGGMGQDFTLNWFMAAGLRLPVNDTISLLGGAYFQHNSNGGMTDPNPGIDALGFTIGAGYSF